MIILLVEVLIHIIIIIIHTLTPYRGRTYNTQFRRLPL